VENAVFLRNGVRGNCSFLLPFRCWGNLQSCASLWGWHLGFVIPVLANVVTVEEGCCGKPKVMSGCP